jgi:outer membrane protein OmpA-like peptidoglycan-associated protein
MPTSRRFAPALLTLCVSLSLTGSASAQAPQQRSFSPQMFHPAPGPDTFVTVEPAAPLRHLQWGVGLYLNYARNPLSILTYEEGKGGPPSSSAENSARANIIRNMIGGELWGALGLIGRLQLAISIPMTLWQNGSDFVSPNPVPDGTTIKAGSGFAFGDPRLYIKVRAYGKDTGGFQLGFSHWLGFPLGSNSQFGGEKNYTGFHGELRALAGWDAERFHIGAFLGLHWRVAAARFFSTTFGTELGECDRIADPGCRLPSLELTFGGAASIVAVKRWLTVVAELYGFHDFSTNINAGPLEIDVSAKVGVYPGLTLNAGIGNGLIAGVGAPQPRVFLGVVYVPDTADRDKDGVPDSTDKCPDVPEDKDGFQDKDGCPDPDNDQDTILDREDKCPNDKEDFDDFEDADGCPEPDNDQDKILDINDLCPMDPEDGLPPRSTDGCPRSKTDTDKDGVMDDKDKCPQEPEDKDGFEDDDGCPDPDNDGDGVPDEFDQCPLQAEDADNFKDEDGCPDPDNDSDGILDKDDKCPNEPETINGYQDEDGCPDKGPPSKVKIERGQIVILEKVFFDTAKARIKPKSFNLLDQVALTIKAHADFKIRVEGHTDSQGKLEANIKLSQERADAVRDYLISRGIDKERLSSAGYGSAQPIADNKSAKGREANRRVEFHIVEAPKPKPAAPAEEGTEPAKEGAEPAKDGLP